MILDRAVKHVSVDVGVEQGERDEKHDRNLTACLHRQYI